MNINYEELIKIELSEIEKNIIRALVYSLEGYFLDIDDLKKKIGVENQLANEEVKYYLDKLREKGLIGLGGALTPKGRAYWMEIMRP